MGLGLPAPFTPLLREQRERLKTTYMRGSGEIYFAAVRHLHFDCFRVQTRSKMGMINRFGKKYMSNRGFFCIVGMKK